MSVTEKSDAASGKKRWKPWQKNLIFALVVLAVAAALYFGWRAARGSKGTGLEAVVDFGSGASETLSLDEDHDYLYDVGDYVVHLQVKDGAIAFLDSQCPDHICEQFGWLDKEVPGRLVCRQACMWWCRKLLPDRCTDELKMRKGQCTGAPVHCLFCVAAGRKQAESLKIIPTF